MKNTFLSLLGELSQEIRLYFEYFGQAMHFYRINDILALDL